MLICKVGRAPGGTAIAPRRGAGAHPLVSIAAIDAGEILLMKIVMMAVAHIRDCILSKVCSPEKHLALQAPACLPLQAGRSRFYQEILPSKVCSVHVH